MINAMIIMGNKIKNKMSAVSPPSNNHYPRFCSVMMQVLMIRMQSEIECGGHE